MSTYAPISMDMIGSDSWDSCLAQLGGHPLQSALWGRARTCLDGIRDTHWVARQGTGVVWMARVEERPIPGFGRIAWIPRGPAVDPKADQEALTVLFQQRLRDRGFILAVMSPWQIASSGETAKGPSNGQMQPRTIWIDLRSGREHLWRALDKQWRYGVGRAERSGVNVRQTDDPAHVDWFYRLCHDISKIKGFMLPASLPLMQRLVKEGRTGLVQAHLFVAEHEGRLGAGALIMRCGSSVHYMWGGTDREFSKLRLGEAIQWGVMEWALKEGCHLYDLEGVDPTINAGTYAFKKKMGGMEVLLAPRSVWPLTLRGRLLAKFV